MINFSSQKPRHFPYVALLLTVAFVVFFALTEFSPYQSRLLDAYAIQTLGYWDALFVQPMESLRLVTATFLHGNALHWIINNSIFLLLAFALEREIGGQKFFLVFILSGIMGNLAASLMLQNQDNLLLGASGAVSGMIGMWLVLFPQKSIEFIVPIGLYLQKVSMPISVVIVLWLIIQIILQFQPNPSYEIAWIGHIVGFATGFLIALPLKKRVKN